MEEKIGDLIDALSNKYEQTFQLESIDKNSSIMETTLINPIKLDSKRTYKAAMLFFSSWRKKFAMFSSQSILCRTTWSSSLVRSFIPDSRVCRCSDSSLSLTSNSRSMSLNPR